MSINQIEQLKLDLSTANAKLEATRKTLKLVKSDYEAATKSYEADVASSRRELDAARSEMSVLRDEVADYSAERIRLETEIQDKDRAMLQTMNDMKQDQEQFAKKVSIVIFLTVQKLFYQAH